MLEETPYYPYTDFFQEEEGQKGRRVHLRFIYRLQCQIFYFCLPYFRGSFTFSPIFKENPQTLISLSFSRPVKNVALNDS